MAHTSLAQQLRKLATPQTNVLFHRKTRPSLLFDPSEAAEIDRITFYDIGFSGLNELKEVNEVFEEFRTTLFDETSKNFERAVETFDVNHKLNKIIKKFLYLVSPYFLLKPTQKVLEWLIVRFHIHEYNTNDLICSALPYHGTRLFARLIQVLDLKKSNPQWQWLYPLQKKGVPLSKLALFNHCSSDVNFLKMICDLTVDAVKIFESNASKLTTLFAFYSTTIIGTIQNTTKITEVQLTHMLPSIVFGLSSDCVDYCASSFMIISSILVKSTFQDRLRHKLSEKIAKINHKTLRTAVLLLLNILYQSEKLEKVSLSHKTINNLAASAEWFVPTMKTFLSSGIYSNVFYLLIIRDGLKLLNDGGNNDESVFSFIQNLINLCRVDDPCAEKMIKIIIDEARQNCDEKFCDLVKSLENQYPVAWDNAIVSLFKEEPNDSLSRVLGFTSATTQVEIFQKLYHPIAAIRTEAIKNIANNADSFKISYIESSLRARWNDEDPSVIEAMFLLPENLRFYSSETFEKLLLRSWMERNDEWNSLLLKILQSLKTSDDFHRHSTKYLILLLPFLASSSKEVQDQILQIDLPLFNSIKKKIKRNVNIAIIEALKSCQNLPSVEDLIEAYRTLMTENVHIFSIVLLLSFMYGGNGNEEKSKILTFFFEDIFPTHFKKVKWKLEMTWNEKLLCEYYSQTTYNVPREIAYKFFESIIQQTTASKEFPCSGWCDFADEHSILTALLYKYLSQCSKLDDDVGYKIFISPLIEKLADTLPGQLSFLCNMCVIYQHEPQIHLQSLKMIHQLLSTSKENFHPWALSAKSDSIFVPCLLISLHSTESALRTQAMEIVETLTQCIGLSLGRETSYAEFLKYLRQFAEEIIIDRDQLLSRLYAFLAQDDDVQSLLPVAIRCCFTKVSHDSLLACITDERTPLLVSASLLQTFEYLRDSVVVRNLAPLATRVVRGSHYPNDAGSQIVRWFIDKFSVATVRMVLDDEAVFAFIDYCVQNYAAVKIRTESGVFSVGTLILQKFAVDLFDKLDASGQKYFLDFVLRVCSCSEASDVVPAANSFMKKVTLNCELLVPYLTRMQTVSLVKTKNKSTPERRSTDDEPSVLRKSAWRMGIALLELIQNKKKICKCHLIIPSLFAVLQKCCEVDDHLPMEYAKQVCLSCVLNCSQKMTAKDDTKQLETMFNVELIVNCIRMSPNPQTHHHALLLLAHGASFAPNQVLHNIMAIFTFMGSSVLRQDDAFSLQIISNILETIVPLLVKEMDGQTLSSSAIVNVLRVFAVSIPDIPDHRRIPLLLKLMKILRDGEFAHLLVILSLANCAKSTAHGKTVVEVLQELLLLLPTHISLSVFEKVVSYVNELPHNLDEKKSDVSKQNSTLFNLRKHTNKELCHFKYLLLNFTATAVSGYKFIQQISAIEVDKLRSLESYFKGIIEQVILYLKGILDFAASSKYASAKYWKVMISQALEILNKTNALLTSETFIIVIKDLIGHDCLLVQRKSLELLNWRLQAAKEGTLKDEFSPKSLTSLIPRLMKIVVTISDDVEDSGNAHDLKVNQQIALISVKLLAKHCSSGNVQPFRPILSQLIGLQRKKMNEHVLACLVLCVAELMATLKVQAIDVLPKFIPALVSLFEPYQNKDIASNDVILISIITALQKIVETMPNFLSPYLESILFEITRITALLSKENNTENKTEEKHIALMHKLKLIKQKIAVEVPSRVLLPSISASFVNSCETHHVHSIKPLLDILVNSFQKNSQISPELTSLFLSMFDLRCTVRSVTNEEISLVEQYSIQALCSIVLKCSETTFRPFYHKLYDWGVIASKDHLKRDRIITYYSILCSLSENLKSIFVLFASNFIRNAVELLDKNNISKGEQSRHKSFIDDPDKCVLLVDSILKTLHSVFKYDTVKFLTKERFNMLMEPLVNQVENTIGDYESRSINVIIPCIARFAAATSDDSLWKQFNYLVLLKTRHSSPEVRLTALETICAFATHLGDNFLPFLPETVPFIAELLEDENEMVEKHTHKAVQRLEETLGEPIQKYF